MSSAGIQKLFCGIYSVFKCSFDEFVGEKVFSPSYSSAILAPQPEWTFWPTQYLFQNPLEFPRWRSGKEPPDLGACSPALGGLAIVLLPGLVPLDTKRHYWGGVIWSRRARPRLRLAIGPADLSTSPPPSHDNPQLLLGPGVWEPEPGYRPPPSPSPPFIYGGPKLRKMFWCRSRFPASLDPPPLYF